MCIRRTAIVCVWRWDEIESIQPVGSTSRFVRFEGKEEESRSGDGFHYRRIVYSGRNKGRCVRSVRDEPNKWWSSCTTPGHHHPNDISRSYTGNVRSSYRNGALGTIASVHRPGRKHLFVVPERYQHDFEAYLDVLYKSNPKFNAAHRHLQAIYFWPTASEMARFGIRHVEMNCSDQSEIVVIGPNVHHWGFTTVCGACAAVI